MGILTDGVKRISGNIVDVLNSRIYPGTLGIADGRITVIEGDEAIYSTYIIPGLIDAHIHIESSMLVPSEFARLASVHGTVAAVSDQIEKVMPLPMAGIMTDEEGHKAARQYSELDSLAKSLGSKLHAPYMALSFITLLVIPELKLSDKSLFDGERFDLISLFE